MLKKILKQKKAMSLPEYSFLILMIASLLLGSIYLFGSRVSDIFDVSSESIESGSPPEYAGVISLRGEGDMIIENGTELLVRYEENTEVDDLMLAFVMHRADLVTPSGWSVVSSEFVHEEVSNQRLTVLSKMYESSDGDSLVLNQESSGRFIGTVVTVRGKDVSDISLLGSMTGDSNYREGLPVPVHEDGTLVLSAVSEVYVLTNGKPEHFIDVYPADVYAMVTPQAAHGNRLGVAAAWGRADETLPSAVFNVDNVADGSGAWIVTTLALR